MSVMGLDTRIRLRASCVRNAGCGPERRACHAPPSLGQGPWIHRTVVTRLTPAARFAARQFGDLEDEPQTECAASQR